jgi:glycosyltransferase involved in cell wall biosynthesis
MALGIPAVASPVGANKKLIEHNVNGLLASNEDEWVESLTTLIQNAELRHELGMAGRKAVTERYSLEAMLPRLINVLHKVMEQ